MITQSAMYQLTSGDTQIQFHSSGDILALRHQDILLNHAIGNPIDGSLQRLYLRFHHEEGIRSFPLTGSSSDAQFSISESQARWSGRIEDIRYEVTLSLTEDAWFWTIDLHGDACDVDLLYGQDIGLAHQNAIRANEAYVAQYVDHRSFFNEGHGYTVTSRQNQAHGAIHPFMQQGTLQPNQGFSTDGFQFFGLSYKETNKPEILTKKTLENEVYQYEFAYTALQSERFSLQGSATYTFYALVQRDHPEAVEQPINQQEILNRFHKSRIASRAYTQVNDVLSPLRTIPVLSSEPLNSEELFQLYPERILEEKQHGSLLSFFTPSYEHIVLPEKELQSERSHGHIIMSGNNHTVAHPTITSTSYMPGIINAQLVIGNTSMNKLLSNVRNPLNILKTSGQRLYVLIDQQWHLLTMPAVYELGLNYSRWIYKIGKETITVTSWSYVNEKTIDLSIEATRAFSFMVSNQIVMNNNEYDTGYAMEHTEQTILFTADTHADNAQVEPDLAYRMIVEDAPVKSVETLDASLVTITLSPSASFRIRTQGTLNGTFEKLPTDSFEEACAQYRTYYDHLLNGFTLEHPDSKRIQKVNAISRWYTHNMLVHFSVPHGLEQYSGAAWGTRDVCQGPFEYFLATQNYDAAREIIRHVYQHQYEDQGDWPQWFMFDRYQHIQHDHSHGDVIVWPLKIIADYLHATGDTDILSMPIPYTNRNGFQFTETTATLQEHIDKQLHYIHTHFLRDTHLSSYGDGDWDDTLQPANKQLRTYMVSSWTVALTCQSVQSLADALKNAQPQWSETLQTLASAIRDDFRKYVLNNKTIPGFLYFEDPEKPENMLHPTDTKTGIHYRLLPMTRSMISELLTPEEVKEYEKLIHEQFHCPDGVRLMNRPAIYNGGISTHFQRAETAANFGREIGLQYVHAHIRYVEAMAKIGRDDQTWKGLETINPIGITETVPNAELRQSNAYFSSSDGKFPTRYHAQENFHLLRTGNVPVKGGWRIYSSGPGIYINQLLTNTLGIRQRADQIQIDPVLPAELNGLTLHYKIEGKAITIRYHLGTNENKATLNSKPIETTILKNRYRTGGISINKKTITTLPTDSATLDVWINQIKH